MSQLVLAHCLWWQDYLFCTKLCHDNPIWPWQPPTKIKDNNRTELKCLSFQAMSLWQENHRFFISFMKTVEIALLTRPISSKRSRALQVVLDTPVRLKFNAFLPEKQRLEEWGLPCLIVDLFEHFACSARAIKRIENQFQSQTDDDSGSDLAHWYRVNCMRLEGGLVTL